MSSNTSTTQLETRVPTPIADIEKVDNKLAKDAVDFLPKEPLTGLRKWLIVSLLCCAQFFDIFNGCGAIVALPVIGRELNFTPGSTQWIISAYTLTFAAFLVSAGRLSDIYNAKLVFCYGFLAVGILSVLCAVSVHPVMLLIFRALQGIGAAMTLPSATAMIVQGFPDPKEQGRVLAIFGAFGAIGNVTGFIIGGVLTAQVSWRWVFYLVAIVVIPFSILSFIFLPSTVVTSEEKRSLDWPGVATLTAGLILFVFAISDANAQGWGSAAIVTTLVLSVVLMVAFFFIERIVKDPAVPPRTWTNKNFLPLFIFTLSIYWYMFAIQTQLVQIFQDFFLWSPLSASIHFLPIGIAGGITAYSTGFIAPHVPRKILLLAGQALMAGSAVIFAFANTSDKYWSHMVPAMIIGVTGLATAYVGASIAIMADARKSEEGIVGAMLNTGLQIGATVGLAVVTAVTLGVNQNQPHDPVSQFKGYQASFWSILALNGIMMVISVVFVK